MLFNYASSTSPNFFLVIDTLYLFSCMFTDACHHICSRTIY